MKNLEYWLILVMAIGFTSCTPTYYVPTTQNVPLISEKNETNITLSGNGSQLGFQVAYGVSESFAIKANGNLFHNSVFNIYSVEKSGKLLEFGGGYFKPINNNWVFETYAIIGMGSFENHFSHNWLLSSTSGDISANILKIGIQPNFGYKSKHFSAAISSRLTHLNYSKIRGDWVFGEVNQQSYLEGNSFNLLLEPSLTLRGGSKNVKMQLQYGHSLNLSNSAFYQEDVLLTIGLNFNFN